MQQFRSLKSKHWYKMIGEDHRFTDPSSACDEQLGSHRDSLNDRVAAWCSSKHIRQMGYYQLIDYPGLPAPVPIVETPFRLGDTNSHSRAGRGDPSGRICLVAEEGLADVTT